jgi:hypothetical protein
MAKDSIGRKIYRVRGVARVKRMEQATELAYW